MSAWWKSADVPLRVEGPGAEIAGLEVVDEDGIVGANRISGGGYD
jgi:hypothetical protein